MLMVFRACKLDARPAHPKKTPQRSSPPSPGPGPIAWGGDRKGRRRGGLMERREEEEGPEAKWPRPSHGRKWDIFGERREREGGTCSDVWQKNGGKNATLLWLAITAFRRAADR